MAAGLAVRFNAMPAPAGCRDPHPGGRTGPALLCDGAAPVATMHTARPYETTTILATVQNMSASTALEETGDLIARRYRVDELLGRGGMAAVYRVQDERTGKALALKRGWSSDPNKLRARAELLKREFHTLAQLAHPRIIEVYDYGVDDRGPYYTMELLSAGDLENAERLPWRETAAVLCDVASSLAIVHSRGLVHRDVSLRNVRYSKDGRAKLIDFGALATMGVPSDVIGTPPFIAPEVVQLQALDGRVDLFALGALGYRLLTGRHAYPARRVSDLRDVWRSRPAPPSSLVPDVPIELSGLIQRLLAFDRGGRPQIAAEVIERLRAIAGLAPDDSAEVTRAYLTAPVLVGREPALLEIRKHMLSLVRGDGGLLLLRGESGAGRSRMLDACALEGKLLGASILRADVRDAGGGDWGVVRALGNQLLEQFPQAALEACRLTRNVLGELFETLRGEETTHTATAFTVERSILIRDLRDWILAVAKVHRLLILVDDLERIDEPSIAFIAALAHRAERHPVLVALATDRSSRGSLAGPLRLLDDLGRAVELDDVMPHETDALMRSVFGDVANVSLCAARIHGLSNGNPRATMELAQHLVSSGRARYEAGRWALPGALDETDLPSSLAASLSARLTELSADARELAAALAIADEDMLDRQQYPELTRHRDVERVYRALDELVAARMLVTDVARHIFAQRGFVAVLNDALSPESRAAVHRKVARVLADQGGDVLRRAHHLLAANQDSSAVELLSRADLHSLNPPVDLLQRAIAAAERLGFPAAICHRLRMTLLVHAPMTLDHAALSDVYAVVLRQLDRDSGLARYRQLEDVPPAERLTRALAETQQAYEQTPESERVHTVFEAVRELARLSGAVTAMAVNTFDLTLVETLPALDPLFPLSPTLPVIAQIVESGKEWIRGRNFQSRAMQQRVLERIAEPDRAGFDPNQYERTRLAIEYGLGLSAASIGVASAEDHASILEEHRAMRVNAWRIRSLFQLALGSVSEARRCARRAELLEAQEGLHERYSGSSIGVELLMYLRLGDLLGIKGLLDRVSLMAARYPGWQPVEHLGRAAYAEVQGDFAAALPHIEAGVAALPPLRHPFFVMVAASHIRVLLGLGRVEDAVRHGRAYVQLSTEHELPGGDVMMATALALGRVGEYTEAVAMLSTVIALSEQLGREGLGMAVLFEARARLAIWMKDRTAFVESVERCSIELACANNPALAALPARLYDEAHEAGVIVRDASMDSMRSVAPSVSEAELESVHSRMAECFDASDRARCALTLLLQSTRSTTGYLYALGADGQLRLIASLPDPPADPELARWVQQHADAWLVPGESDATVTGTVSANQTHDAPAPNYVDGEGRTLEATLLVGEVRAMRTLTGLLVWHVTAGRRFFPPRALTSMIAKQLLDYGDAAAISVA